MSKIDIAEQLENIRFFAQDLLDTGHLFGGQVGSIMGIRDAADAAMAALSLLLGKLEQPIPMLLFCPKCGEQHVDEAKGGKLPMDGGPYEPWTNPPHRSHLCGGCGCIWRPADVVTTGVKEIATVGKADNWSREASQARVAELTAEVERVTEQSKMNYDDATQLGGRLEAAEALVARLRGALAYWNDGAKLIETCLVTAIAADPLCAPMPLLGAEAALWHQASANAYRHALEMMGPTETHRQALQEGGQE